jgi:tetratricopeptide (TPR) repeat protein
MTYELKKQTREKLDLSQGFENVYMATNPFLYLTYSNLGDYYLNMKDYLKAYSYYKLALAMQVAGEDIRRDLEKLCEESLKKSKNAKKGD